MQRGYYAAVIKNDDIDTRLCQNGNFGSAS